ncbi:putative phosphomannomutase [Corynebacterium ciconiae DSM 44920]|uniref:phospho-sugar mutase n=1 Tax=Corynebacterium ciconiae TaxID=227319 RepID=UPI00036028CC|nr:phospho-sugar mutase [Corynebacterium ciconiae]WKD60456.1 putative phosphomannomutase [Corynebacterium ciconiae DSM 44920]
MTIDSTRISDWIAHDPDPATAAELKALLDAGDTEELAARFSGPLEFGTAGLRGRYEAGESRMNVATVSRATAGLAAWLTSKVERPVVVIGCDARYGSAEFHQAAAEIFAAAGCIVHLIPPQLPTPFTAFCVRYFDADAGVMVTASHNPPKDNGYKVYLGGRVVDGDAAKGVQLISPADKDIAKLIAAAPAADEIVRRKENIEPVDESVLEEYLSRAVSLRRGSGESDLPIVFTAMHGVGGEVLDTVLSRAGFTKVTAVAEQREPNPDFPTVSFPNPEEDGALDLSIATAQRSGAELILALDPDADRCSVAIPTAEGWRQLSGDEVGAVLAEDIARTCAGSGATLAASIVSSRLLGKVAERHGLRFQPTLTGFKWIARTPEMVMGYEEALGYCTDPEVVRDKDGITACLRVADVADRLRAEGKSLQDFLDEIAADYGLYVTSPLTFRMSDPADIAAALEKLKTTPPTSLAGATVTDFSDLSEGFRGLPPTTGFWVETDGGDRIVARPSGTEPKLKCYLEVIATDRPAAEQRLAQLKTEFAAALGL